MISDDQPRRPCGNRDAETPVPGPERSDVAKSALEKQIEIRWRDVDAAGHVNNAVYLTYLEEARIEWLRCVLGSEGDQWDFVLAHVSIDYLREIRQSDEIVLVCCGLARIGRSSIETHEKILAAEGWEAARAMAVLVARDRATGRSRPLSAGERRSISSWGRETTPEDVT
jgi:acyl-CoA thioester hydrolase